jgi:hypothetical protein
MARYSSAVLDALPLAGAEWEAMQTAARAALALDGDGSASWTPRPHQIPPDGDWDLWLLLGGRGAGKTDAAAAATNAHVTGPPCLPGIPGGHRIAIVAPTLGDASEACVNGPSGLRKHNPGVRLVSRMGGTFVVWPGGAEARCSAPTAPRTSSGSARAGIAVGPGSKNWRPGRSSITASTISSSGSVSGRTRERSRRRRRSRFR